MNRTMLLALAMLAGGAVGAIAIKGLHAPVTARRGYAVEISKIPGGSGTTKITPKQQKNIPEMGDFDSHNA